MPPLEPSATVLRYLSCQTRLEFDPETSPRFLSAKGARAGSTALYITESVVVVYSWLESRPDAWTARATLTGHRVLKDGTPSGNPTSFDWYQGKSPAYTPSEAEVDGIMSALAQRHQPRHTPAQVAEDLKP